MLPRYVRLFGSALLIDGVLFGITVPFTHFLLLYMVPVAIVTPGVVGTYGAMIFCIFSLIIIFLLWFFESFYQHLFSFWQLVITMALIMGGILYLNR